MILNLAAAWKELVAPASKGTFDENDRRMFYTGATAALIIVNDIQELHSDNPAAMKVLMENIGEEMNEFRNELRRIVESEA